MDYRSDRPLRDNERTLIELLRSIEIKYDPLLIIVEGNRDEAILRNLGVKGQIIKTQTLKTREQLIDSIADYSGPKGNVLILTDFDAEGIELCKSLERALELKKVKMLRRLRLRIRNLMGNWRCIEELVALFRRVDSPEPEGYS
ncbi:MAG: toprim domain-containing protein [Candidatus Thorarchaeota archaeon]